MVADDELIRRVAAGDREAYAALYDRYAPRVFGLLSRLLRNQSDIDDVFQDVFWQVWAQAGRFDPSRGRPDVWVLLLTRSRAMDQNRKSDRQIDAAESPEPPAPASPPDDAQRSEMAALIRDLLRLLPTAHSHAVQRAFFDGWTHEEIARREGLPLGTVKSHVRRGMDRLRVLLADHDRDRSA